MQSDLFRGRKRCRQMTEPAWAARTARQPLPHLSVCVPYRAGCNLHLRLIEPTMPLQAVRHGGNQILCALPRTRSDKLRHRHVAVGHFHFLQFCWHCVVLWRNTAAARKMHVHSKELVCWVKSGRLRNSLYQIIDPFYCLACIGNDSCISY